MCDQLKVSARTTVLRETARPAATTVIAITSCPETISRFHYEFRLFDDLCLLQIDVQQEGADLGSLLDELIDHSTDGHYFVLHDRDLTLGPADSGPPFLYPCPPLTDEHALQQVIETIKVMTRQRRGSASPSHHLSADSLWA
jgi:hypothetical protein